MSTRNSDPATYDRSPIEMTVEDGHEKSAVVRVVGAVDEDAAAQFESQLRDQLNPAGSLVRLVVDLSAVESMATDGLTALLEVEKSCFARSVRLCLVSCSPPVMELIESAGLTGHFRHYSAVAEVTA
jgi:anti-anti-sigma factor